MDARLDKLSIDFDDELYPHMLTAIAGRRWVIGHDMRLAVMKCAESSEIREHLGCGCGGKLAKTDLKDLKYPMVDQLEKLRDAPMELIMASLHLESDTGEDAPSWIRDLRPSTSQLKIHVYPEPRREEKEVSGGLAILLANASTQTEISKGEASPRLLRSMSLQYVYLDWYH
ncbi:hypothetical protein Tco_1502802 [Tanacetum coccineum]